jgi:hypothetical protein
MIAKQRILFSLLSFHSLQEKEIKKERNGNNPFSAMIVKFVVVKKQETKLKSLFIAVKFEA